MMSVGKSTIIARDPRSPGSNQQIASLLCLMARVSSTDSRQPSRMQFTTAGLLKLTAMTALLLWMLWDSEGRFTFSLSFVVVAILVLLTIELVRWLRRKKRK